MIDSFACGQKSNSAAAQPDYSSADFGYKSFDMSSRDGGVNNENISIKSGGKKKTLDA